MIENVDMDTFVVEFFQRSSKCRFFFFAAFKADDTDKLSGESRQAAFKPVSTIIGNGGGEAAHDAWAVVGGNGEDE